jgi:multidrug efflux system outer membrane protein
MKWSPGALLRARFAASAAVMALLVVLVLAGCANVAPAYQKPAAPAVPAYKEAIPPKSAKSWKIAEPSDALARGEWWTIFGDAKLDELQAQAAAANPSLKRGLAQLQQARAIVRAVDADRRPQVDVGAGVTRTRPSPASLGLPADAESKPLTLWRTTLSASWEVDLFGRIANQVTAAQADAAQTEALYRSLLLAIQADVASQYLALRGLDAEIALLADTVRLREEALGLVERRFSAGDIAEVDVARARTELSTARADRIALSKSRAEVEHALAVLLGKAPSELNLDARPLAFQPIAIPPGLPSQLLERRPDIAAAERAMAAANARIGVAKAAYFPRLSLTGFLGLESGDLGDLFKSNSRTWALGPLAGTMLSLPIFDGGRRGANEASALAAYDEAAADYRGSVLGALREVEDGLSGLRLLADQADELRDSVVSAQRAAYLSNRRYGAGQVAYFDVIDAERQVLATRRAATQVERERALATVALVRALGGSWGDLAPVAAPTGAPRG